MVLLLVKFSRKGNRGKSLDSNGYNWPGWSIESYLYDGVTVGEHQGVDGDAPGGRDEGHGEGDDGTQDEQRVKHG